MLAKELRASPVLLDDSSRRLNLTLSKNLGRAKIATKVIRSGFVSSPRSTGFEYQKIFCEPRRAAVSPADIKNGITREDSASIEWRMDKLVAKISLAKAC